MSQYIVLSHIEVQNANSIAGFTWGFPGITGFLGFTHALSRKISNQFEGDFDTTFDGCAIVCHQYQNKVYQPKKYADFEFIQSRNPPVLEKNKNGKSVPVIEEGKMNLTVSLVIQLSKSLVLTGNQIQQFEQRVLSTCYGLRLVGGTILSIKQIKLLSSNTLEQQQSMLKKIKRLTLPGFVLFDRSYYLKEHYQSLLDKYVGEIEDQPTLFDAWLDFCALKSEAIPKLHEGQIEPDSNTDADWQYVPKHKGGYLVPLMTGYKAISEVYEPRAVANTRDANTPSCFVEAIHSIGKWKGVHSLASIESAIWSYRHDGQWYLCKQKIAAGDTEDFEDELKSGEQELLQSLNFNDALNNW